jgi:tetratricopeptide (TPR) repeat protein
MRKRFSPAFVVILAVPLGPSSAAQVSSKAPPANPNAVVQHAVTLAQSGRCTEALPLLAKSLAHVTDKDLQKKAGFYGVRCASTLQQDETLVDFLRIMNRQFPRDPEVLYVSVHAYSDLSSRKALELARTAPKSIPAMRLDAEANELQGKWDEAEKDYRKILAENPNYPGIHFLLARILLSKPNPGPDFKEEAKKELQQELEIDPSNAGAEYILGELARQTGDLDSAIQHFSKATKLDATFADAYLGLGSSLLTEKNYVEAIPPLEKAVKLQPENPAGHYSLATAYARSGRKEDAQREFALHQQTSERAGGQGAQNPQ